MPESTRMIKDGSYLAEAMEATDSRVMGWAASYGMVQWAGWGMG